MNKNENNPSHKRQLQDTDLWPFLSTVSHFDAISHDIILTLSRRFQIDPESFVCLINFYGGRPVYHAR